MTSSRSTAGLLARVEQLVAEATDAYERYWTPDVVASFESFVDDLSNWYIRRSRRRFWNGDAAALETLRAALLRSIVVIAPVMPFLGEHLWRILRSDDQPDSVFLVRWQDAGERDLGLLDEVAQTRQVVDLGHQARGEAGIKLRQPLRRAYVRGATAPPDIHARWRRAQRQGGLFDDAGPRPLHSSSRICRCVGHRLGARLRDVRRRSTRESTRSSKEAACTSPAKSSAQTRCCAGERSRRGLRVAQNGALSVALDAALDEELLREGVFAT